MSIEYQLVEQRTENPCVPGSISSNTTLKVRELHFYNSLFCAVLSPFSTGLTAFSACNVVCPEEFAWTNRIFGL